MIKLYYSFIERPEPDATYPGYTYEFVTVPELRQIEKLNKNFGFWPLIHMMFHKERCFAIKDNKKIVSFLIIGTTEVHYAGTHFNLKNNEATLYYTWTLKEHRGNGLAVALRKKTYSLLLSEGRDTIYSFTDYNNKSGLRFKDKICAEKLALYLYIRLFKWSKRIKLKQYKRGGINASPVNATR